ncbi:MAG: type II toxin-antitoxin system prevent-host-death family antitoxin [Deltaproteobacteria bacterium]|nr:type II toxin-antitoxin system prevent-host-death family antitoxin [Deltaproteobacteria bacterium]
MWSHVVMTQVKIAQFKSQLSGFLKRVRAGETLIVTDRETPIAQVLPYQTPSDRLTILAAKQTPKMLKKIKVPKARKGTDSLKVLLEERSDDLEQK